MGVNTAEWAWENPTQAAAFGAQPPHSMPPVITSTPTTGDSDQEYIAHTYAASVNLDPTRTLSNLRLELVDVNQLLAYRSPSYGVPTWIAQACMAVTLEGRSATQIPTTISIDEATLAEMIDVSQNGAALYNERSVEVGEEKARQDTINWLKEQDIIADAGLSEDGTTIWIDYANGVKGAIFTASQVEESPPVSFSSLRQDYRSLNQVSMMATNLRQDLSSAGNHPNMVGNRLAIVLCPFEHEIKGPAEAATDQIRDHLRSCGFSVEYISNQEVNVKLLRDINRYGVIYLATHGGIRNEEMVLSSGEKPTTKRTNDFYAEDIVGPEGRIGIGTLGHSKESYYIVFPSFFSHYSGDTGFPKSLVYISACNSLKQEDMANAFLAKGVAAYIGYKGLTTIGYAVVATDEPFFRLLAENCITVDEAKNADTTPFLDKWIYMYGYGTVTSRITPWSTRAMNYTGDGKTVICEEEETSDGDFHCPIPIPNEASHIVEDYREYWLTPNGFVGPYYCWYDREKTKKRYFKCYNIEGKLHGVSKGWYEDGTPKREWNYKDGKDDGVSKGWYEDGTPKYEWNYKDGKEHGVYKDWYEDGTPKGEWNYKDGTWHGVYKDWYEDGTPKLKWNYKDGKKHGVCKSWSANGKLLCECNYEEGKCVSCVHGHC
jgi:antitoxin component YwqK of YwqJK toxin-antitoxin module